MSRSSLEGQIRQDPAVARQYDYWAPVYDTIWRRYVDKTLPVLADAAALRPGDRVLDLGCGTGEFERLLMADGFDVDVVGVDVSASMVARARRKLSDVNGISFEQVDVHTLPFDEGAFDVVVCGNAFHYFTSPAEVLFEVRRVLGERGRFVVLDWCRDFWVCRLMDVLLQFIDPAYEACYTLDELATLLSSTGFTVERQFRYRFDLVWGIMVVEARPSLVA